MEDLEEVEGEEEGKCNLKADYQKNMTEEKKEFEKLLKEYRDYAEKNNIHLNPDKKITEGLIKALIEREKKYGARYCPCRLVTKDEKENSKIICPCVYCKKEIEEQGHCHCFLFVK